MLTLLELGSIPAQAQKVVSSEKPLPGWRLTQESYSAGIFDVSICKQAIRIENKKTGIAIISQYPDWKPVYLNDANKLFFPGDIEKLNYGLNKTMAIFGAPVFTDMPVVLLKTTAGDMTVDRYGSPPGFAKQQQERITNKQVSANAAITITFSVWKNEYPQKEGQTLSRLYALPVVKGIPLAFHSENQNHHSHCELATLSSFRTAFSPGLFTVPKSYRQCKSLEELKSSQKDGINMVLDTLADPSPETRPAPKTRANDLKQSK